MTLLHKKKNNGLSSSIVKNSSNTVWEMMRRTANDNTPPLPYWFYKVLIFSLLTFGIIQLISMLVSK